MPHPETWLKVLPDGLWCEPGGFFIDPVNPVERAVITHAHADHARPGNGAVLASAETHGDHGRAHGGRAVGRAASRRWPTASITARGAGAGCSRPGTCWAARRWRWSSAAAAPWFAATTSACRTRPAARSSRSPATSSSPRRPSGCRCSAIRRRQARSRGCWTACALFPERTHVVGCYALGKCQRLIALLRQAGWDRPIYLHGALLPLCARLRGAGHPARRRCGLPPSPTRRSWSAPSCWRRPSAIADRWARRLAEPVTCLASRLDAGAPACPARRASSCRW